MTSTEGLAAAAAAVADGRAPTPMAGWSSSTIHGADGEAEGLVLVPEQPVPRQEVETALGPLRDTARTPGPRAVVGEVDPGDTDGICRVEVELDGDQAVTVSLTRDVRL